jgi:hypothetical protein
MSFRMIVIDVDGQKINLPWSRDEPPSQDEEDAIKERVRADLRKRPREVDGLTGKMSEPTEEGKKRYPPDGIYDDGAGPFVCTCKPECPPACKGKCGCEACHAGYQDFLSCE